MSYKTHKLYLIILESSNMSDDMISIIIEYVDIKSEQLLYLCEVKRLKTYLFPNAITCSKKNEIYINTTNSHIIVLDSDCKFIREFDLINLPFSITIKKMIVLNDELITLEAVYGRVFIYDTYSNYKYELYCVASSESNMFVINNKLVIDASYTTRIYDSNEKIWVDMFKDSHHHLYYTHHNNYFFSLVKTYPNDSILIYNSKGEYIRYISLETTHGNCIAVHNDIIYVSTPESIHIFNLSGRFLRKINFKDNTNVVKYPQFVINDPCLYVLHHDTLYKYNLPY
jgi:hypothetical protein